jgi:ATP-dependent DNA helicase RecG
MLGTKQSGDLGLKVADILRDGAILEKARQAAQKLIAADPTLSRPEHAGLRRRIQRVRPEESAIVVS